MRAEKDSIGEWYRGVPLSAKWPIFAGLAILVVWLGCFGVWAGVAPLNSAVVAPGTFVATGQNKLVQHFEGGIIREIAVKDGDAVEANEDLVRLDGITILDRNLADDATLEVLDQLVLSGGHERSRGDDRTIQWSDSGPNTETTEPNNQDGEAGEDGPFGAQRNAAVPLADAVLFRSHAVLPRWSPHGPEDSMRRASSGLSSPARPGDRTRRCSTSLGDPNASARPARRMSTLSTLFSSAGRRVTTTAVTPRFLARCRVSVRACSPAASRFELGSSSTTRDGLPKKARASAMRCFCPPESGPPPRSSTVSYPCGS